MVEKKKEKRIAKCKVKFLRKEQKTSELSDIKPVLWDIHSKLSNIKSELWDINSKLQGKKSEFWICGILNSEFIIYYNSESLHFC